MSARQLLVAFMALSVALVAVVAFSAWRRAPAIAEYGFCAVVACWIFLLAWSAREWFRDTPAVLRFAANLVTLAGWTALGAFVWFVLLMNAAESFGLPH